MGYAYYIKMHKNVVAVTTDLGLLIFSVDKWYIFMIKWNQIKILNIIKL